MDNIAIVLGIFFALSFLASIVVIAACALSSQISQEDEWSEEHAIYTIEPHTAQEAEFLKDSAPA